MNENEIAIVDESSIKGMVYEIRGQLVMLDYDLARIYGYETKRFNEQVKNNEDRFPEDFRFRLTLKEARLCSRSKFSTLNAPSERGKNVKHLPYAFTEQGIYMLMTVLRGELAVRQSIALIKLFKSMKDYLSSEQIPNQPIGILKRLESAETRIGVVESKLGQVMEQFEDPRLRKEVLIMDGERVEAGIAYRKIYSLAKRSLILIDDYLGPKTLSLLKSCKQGISVAIISDNKGPEPLRESDILDFHSDKGIKIEMRKTHERVHDRYIVLDYGFSSEMIYHCGASSKDAGSKITTIMAIENPLDFHRMIEGLLS